MRHTVVYVENRLVRTGTDGLIKAHGIAEQNFACPHLDQCWWERLEKITINRGRIGIALVFRLDHESRELSSKHQVIPRTKADQHPCWSKPQAIAPCAGICSRLSPTTSHCWN